MWNKRVGFFGLAALNLFLLSPLLYNLRVGEGYIGIYDTVVWWNILCSIVFLFSFQILFKKPLTFHLLASPLYITVLVDLYLINFYDARLSSGYIWIVVANIHDSLDYIRDFRTPIIIGITSFLFFYLFCLWSIRAITIDSWKRRPLAFFSLLFLAFLYVGIAARQTINHGLETYARGFADILEMDLSSPAGVISQAITVYSSVQRHQIDQQQREKFSFGAVKEPSDQPEVYVFVIGESVRSDRLGLNGYHRDTTPRLDDLDNLVSYSDAICEYPLTQYSVPIMLSRADIAAFDKAFKEKSVVAAMNEAGFETHWISTQPFSYYGGFIHLLAGDADNYQYLDRVHDGVMLDTLDEVLANAKTGARKTFIVIHTLGSHQSYAVRYPSEFKIFDEEGADLTRKEQLNNTYDNSIIYTDWFLSEVIGRLEALDIAAGLMYASDHGENLLDDEKELLGHGFGNAYDFPIPILFWHSDEYKERFPEKVANARQNKNAKLSTANMFYALADMADIRFDGFQPEMSFLDTSHTARPRIVYGRADDILFDYDQPANVVVDNASHVETYRFH